VRNLISWTWFQLILDSFMTLVVRSGSLFTSHHSQQFRLFPGLMGHGAILPSYLRLRMLMYFHHRLVFYPWRVMFSGAALVDLCSVQQKPLGTGFYGHIIIRSNCRRRNNTCYVLFKLPRCVLFIPEISSLCCSPGTFNTWYRILYGLEYTIILPRSLVPNPRVSHYRFHFVFG
jgi:hypothetical protein